MPAGGWRQSKLGWSVQRSPPPVFVPAKSVAGRAVLSQVKLWLPPFFGALPVSVPFGPKNQERARVPGIGKRLKSRSNPGYGTPGAPPAPLSNMTFTCGWAWKAARAASYVGWFWIGSGGRVTPLIPIAV